jgi:hypothetical protein
VQKVPLWEKPLRLVPVSHSAESSNKAEGKTAIVRMYYPYVFEYTVEAKLIKDGRSVELLIEPSITDLIAEFSKSAILKMAEENRLSLNAFQEKGWQARWTDPR